LKRVSLKNYSTCIIKTEVVDGMVSNFYKKQIKKVMPLNAQLVLILYWAMLLEAQGKELRKHSKKNESGS
jgi:hypothetical protein